MQGGHLSGTRLRSQPGERTQAWEARGGQQQQRGPQQQPGQHAAQVGRKRPAAAKARASGPL